MEFKIYILTIAVILTMNNCRKEKKDDVLSLKREPYTGSELRIDGYYFNKYGTGNLTVYFFYDNGILLYGSSFPIDHLSEHESDYIDGEHYEFAKNLKYYWGVFNINGGEIMFERWYPSQPPLRAFISSGTILNDTTFHINRFYHSDGSVSDEVNETYHFRQFTPKPDSTNIFIK
jgi:hypothetical protein